MIKYIISELDFSVLRVDVDSSWELNAILKSYPITDEDQKIFYIRIYNGNLKITKNMLNLVFFVYNGRFFIPIRIIDTMIGFKFKMFSFSKKILLKKIQKIYKTKKK